MITGALVFKGVTLKDMIAKNTECVIPFKEIQWSQVSKHALYFAKALLERDPAKRLDAD